jgi:hypothetical protein
MADSQICEVAATVAACNLASWHFFGNYKKNINFDVMFTRNVRQHGGRAIFLSVRFISEGQRTCAQNDTLNTDIINMKWCETLKLYWI